MKTIKMFLLSAAILVLVGYSVFVTSQVRSLETRVNALEQSQATVTKLGQSVRALQEEQKNPKPRWLSQNASH